ncbi:MAG TPA: N-acetylmuramoyl-L-alanine amidase [Pyrinomonadaceae bacterium]|nr:N-acetylmuramoyl-L-alanine amidase [Pyrinomonadaceae bacterium]
MKAILVSAGHGAGDPGAVSPNGKLKEADLALVMRDTVASMLRARGCRVVEDGEDGQNLPLTYALTIARQTPGPKVEFHFNAGPPTATGVEALSLPQHKPFAQALAKTVSAATGLVARGANGWKDQSSGQHHRLAFCQAGGVILELAFISNDGDMNRFLANEERVAIGIADVLERFARA